MFRHLLFILIASLFFMSSCSDTSQTSEPLALDQLNWLIGKWQMEGKNVFEVWQKDGQKIRGSSFSISNGDTIIYETLTIEIINDTLYYIPTVFDQNDGKAIPFKLESNLATNLVFTNMSHDFPQIIQYLLIGKDTIKVILKGTSDRKNEFMLLRHE